MVRKVQVIPEVPESQYFPAVQETHSVPERQGCPVIRMVRLVQMDRLVLGLLQFLETLNRLAVHWVPVDLESLSLQVFQRLRLAPESQFLPPHHLVQYRPEIP